MGRNATIRIKNETGYLLTHVSDDIKHGKFNSNPPSTIGVGGTGTFEVGNKTGAKIGPKGTTTYRATVNVKGAAVPIDLVFFWDHPFSASTSVYSVTSNPPGHSYFSLAPAFPEDRDQKIDITVGFQNLLSAYDIINWAKYVKGDPSLTELTIPGTHDSGALKGGIAYECQTMDIATQLNKGIRFLDIRLMIKDGVLEVYHGSQRMDITFAQVMDHCISFLNAHPSEFVVMLINREGGDAIQDKFWDAIKDKPDKWWLKNSIPKLSEARGKITLLRRFAADKELGIDASSGWQDNEASFWVNAGNIHVQDKYQVYDTAESINGKWNDITSSLDQAQSQNKGKLYINFTSGATHISPVMLATGEGIVAGTVGINDRLYSKVARSDKSRFGIIVMDFPEKPNELLIPYIIGQNLFG